MSKRHLYGLLALMHMNDRLLLALQASICRSYRPSLDSFHASQAHPLCKQLWWLSFDKRSLLIGGGCARERACMASL